MVQNEPSEFRNASSSGNATTHQPTISKPTVQGFIDDATEIALAAYDDAYTAE